MYTCLYVYIYINIYKHIYISKHVIRDTHPHFNRPAHLPTYAQFLSHIYTIITYRRGRKQNATCVSMKTLV